ncbi:hypothetical protein [Bifidobacterium callitrichos]|uniref:Uncharacterized protein n=1 Tax=Bifidobacterium callitrichos DSM 23973 TaxID=1437609 RepID=A0A087A0M4_9BIFI|nr:hypothetical protein [Bifidobacterium callitrichos]KFI52324.1 hypothetical protein BCAL_1969 [Bifidobacterium callitrichos DSM 23973]
MRDDAMGGAAGSPDMRGREHGRDWIHIGCVVAVCVLYMLLLMCVAMGELPWADYETRGAFSMGTALMINFLFPPVLLGVGMIYGLRPQSLPEPESEPLPNPQSGASHRVADWATVRGALRAFLFPLISALPAFPLIFMLAVASDFCAVNSVCTQVGPWILNWISLGQVWWFMELFAASGCIGLAATLLVRLAARLVRGLRACRRL